MADYTLSYTRALSFTGNYTRDFVKTRTTDYSGDYTRTRTSTYAGNYTRTSTTSGENDYIRIILGGPPREPIILEFVGNYIGTGENSFTQDFINYYTRTSTVDTLKNRTSSYAGTYARAFTRLREDTSFTRNRESTYVRSRESTYTRDRTVTSSRVRQDVTSVGYYIVTYNRVMSFTPYYSRVTRTVDYTSYFTAYYGTSFTRTSTYSRTITYIGFTAPTFTRFVER